MKRILSVCALAFGLCSAPASAQTVTLGGASSVASANDFATTVFQDPWDMNERTDVGWWLNSVDQPFSGFLPATFAGGIFSGTVNPTTPPLGACPTGVDPNRCANPNLWLLESGFPNLAPTGKNGNAYAINADFHHIVALRMRVDAAGYMLFYWSTNTIYDGLSAGGLKAGNLPDAPTTPGWRIYFVDLASLNVIIGTEPWNGTKRSLRIDPVPDDAVPGSRVDIDWIRLVDNQPALRRTVSWSGVAGPVDVYLDNDNTPTSDPNQTLGLVADSVTTGSYSLNAGALAPGTYYVAVRQHNGSGPLIYSTTAYIVNSPATVTVTSPSDEGSADDFATVHLNDPWDMTNIADIDAVVNTTNAGITTVPQAETEAGVQLGDITAFAALSQPLPHNPGQCESYGDPIVYFLRASNRGTSQRIDPNKYRILTAEFGVPNQPRDLCGGSVARVVWQVAGEPLENVSRDIPVNSRAGANVVTRLNVDMAALPLDPSSTSQSGWVSGNSPAPGISSFRIDPHEFPDPTAFYFKRVKLAALETANANYTVRWTASKTGGTVNVYYDLDQDPAAKTLIGSTAASATTGSLVWNTSNLPQRSKYFVYVEFDDGLNVNGAYSKWPVVIEHGAGSSGRIVLNRAQLNFATRGATVRTPPQVVRLTAISAGGPPLCWTVEPPELWFLRVSPTSGCGSALLTVSLIDQNYPWTGEFFGSIVVNSTTAINSPQGLRTTVRMNPSSTPPVGYVDTPVNGAVVSGSFAMTGWATDDTGVARVTVCRDPTPLERGVLDPACGPGQVYLGQAVSIEDARPDVEAQSPTTPLNYRAGWGFLILSNMLPNQGVGTFVLHARAFDVEGQQADLGARTITARNDLAPEPFGAIDTPGQGELISGSGYANFGWVLSRRNRADPPGGGSVIVYVDGVGLGSPGGWSARSDLSALFPSYPGINSALGVFGLDTFVFGDGIHTIAWGVTDNTGVSSGVGSRYFSIFNGVGPLTQTSATAAMRPAGPDLGRQVDELATLASGGTMVMRQGFRLGGATQPVAAGLDGLRRVWSTERDRLELRWTARDSDDATYAGYQLVNGRLRELPLGSSFDPSRGAFYWQPGLGYAGDFDLLFVRTAADGSRERIPVQVTLQRRPSLRASAGASDPWARIDFR